VDARDALAVLGLAPGATLGEARTAYRRLVRLRHPDVAGPDGTAATARLTAAYAFLRATSTDDATPIDAPEPTDASHPAAERTSPVWREPVRSPYDDAVDAELAAGDTLLVHAPPDETFAVLFEAASRVGHIGYFDRQLGILETIVRFEGGPTCSLLITLQGRAHGTEAFCTLESIEADPTPPMRPVIEALVDELVQPGAR
jgi:hypothetical protein